MRTTTPPPPQFRQHLERVRRCIDVTIVHLTTIKALVPTDQELATAGAARSRVDDEELARHRATLEAAMRDVARSARILIDNARSTAGLDPQCCDWPTLEETPKGEC
jgi:hypothetical protein